MRLYPMSIAAILVAFFIASILLAGFAGVAYAADDGEKRGLPNVKVVVKPYPLQAGVGERSKLEFYLVLDRDLNGSLCVSVRVILDQGGLVLDESKILVGDVRVFKLGNDTTDRFCNYAYGGVGGYGRDTYVYLYLSTANVSKGAHKFAVITLVPLEQGKMYMPFSSYMYLLNVTVHEYEFDKGKYYIVEAEIIDSKTVTGYIPITATKATPERMAVAASGALVGLGLYIVAQPIISQYPLIQQHQALVGAVLLTLGLVALLYLLGLLTAPII